MPALVVDALSTLNALDIEHKLILLGAVVGVVGTTMSIFQFSWPVFRRHGFTYRVFQLAIIVAVLSVTIQSSALVADWMRLADLSLLTRIAAGLVVVIVFSATVRAYYLLKERPAFSWYKLIVMFALPLSPVGAFYASAFLRGGAGFLARAL